MYKEDLDRFFKANAVKDDETPSAAALTHFQIQLLRSPEINEQAQKLMDELVFKGQPEREKAVLEEINEIESAASHEQIIRFMRRRTDLMNQHVLVKRALEFEDDLLPEVIKMLKTSLNTGFIETATRVLSLCNQDVADELIGYFDDVRNPYAQSMILVALGFKADETHIPWIIEKYKVLKKLYPNETYYDGAYYALYEIECRFYPTKKK